MKIELVPNWRKLWKSWSLRFAALGATLPEVLQLIADNTGSLTWFDEGYKSGIRLVCLVLVIVLRPVKQEAVSGPKEPA